MGADTAIADTQAVLARLQTAPSALWLFGRRAGEFQPVQRVADFGQLETVLTLPVPGLRDVVGRNLPDPHEVVHRGLRDAELFDDLADGDHLFLFHIGTLAHCNALAVCCARW